MAERTPLVTKWQRLSTAGRETTRGGLVASAGIVMLFNILAKVLGFTRDVILAGYFGAARATDAFYVALNLPQTYLASIGGAIGTGVLPVVTELRVQGKEDEARVVASTILNLTIAVSAAVALGGVVLALPIMRLVATGLAPETLALSASLARLLFVVFVFVGVGSVLGLLLNSLKDFAVPAANPVLVNIFTIAVVTWLARDLGMYAAVYGYAAGAIVQFLLQGYWLRRRGLPPGLSFDLHHPAVRRVLTLAVPVLAGSIVGGIYLTVDNWLASHLAEGSIASKTFALKLIQVPVGILSAAIATVTFPTLSERAARQDIAGLADVTTFGLRAVALVTIPAAVGLAVLRIPVVGVLFERGAWSAEATASTSAVLLYYALGIFAVAATPVPARAFQGMQDMVTPLFLGVGVACLNIVLDLILIRPLGLVGLPLANSVAVTLGLVAYYYLLNRRVHGLPGTKLAASLAKIVAASVAMGLVVWAAVPVVSRLVPNDGTLIEASKLLALIVLGGLVYLAALIALRQDDVQSLGSLLRRTLARAR
ncbi:MAG TPA: murein biosynthesis integral membrane protein MurJ [Bacillota bacterium]